MKRLCYNKIITLLLLFTLPLFANLQKKSAIVYYGEDISYSMVGIHDYIIVEPNNIDTYRHGFELYKKNIYAYVSIGEIDKDIPAYKILDKKLIIGKNRAWKSDVLDITNPAYKKFLFEKVIDPLVKKGFKNFFFDTLDSYELVTKTQKERQKSQAALIDIIKSFKQRYTDAKLIINRGFEIIDAVHDDIEAMLFESYYYGVGGENLAYKKVSQSDRAWLDAKLKKVQKYHKDIICVDYLPLKKIPKEAQNIAEKLQNRGFIPYIATRELDTYGVSSKNPIKREILTLIDESQNDRITSTAHRLGALALEYQGYIQALFDISRHKLPSMTQMQRYQGVIIWLFHPYKESHKLISWIKKLQKYNIKVVFAGDFYLTNLALLQELGLKVNDTMQNNKQLHVVTKDPMMGFEINPPLNSQLYSINLKEGRPLYSVANQKDQKSTLAAVTPWGGYAVSNAFTIELAGDDLWSINPFEFFKTTLRLQQLPVPDTTTLNGKRILFSHIDGDGIMNRVEWDPKLFSGDTIYSDILSRYKMPISVSVIGAEINNNGLYPKLAPQLQSIVKKMYALKNVEPATHTFTHPFFWEKIDINGDLSPKYRLKPKGYRFSLDYEIKGMLDEINKQFLPKNKEPKAQTVFWSGNCAPTEKVLHNIYKNHLLNINGGDTYINNLHPWLSYVSPMGIKRGGYYQIYTGQQNENIYTNEWLGPFWGFKKVVQTFELTDKPKRLKPIDIYYHLYSGSKQASLNALKYVYNWALKEDVSPIFTSEYIPKVMDYYEISIAKEQQHYLIKGVKNLKTLRIDKRVKKYIPLTQNLAGERFVNKSLYLHIGDKSELTLTDKAVSKLQTPYLVSANAKSVKLQRRATSLHMELQADVALELEVFVPKKCKLTFTPKAQKRSRNKERVKLFYKDATKADIDVQCKL
jgi:hypothetical protein